MQGLKLRSVDRMPRTRKVIKYHGRRGRPVIHTAKNGKRFIMVRKTGGGVKRLYEGSHYRDGGISRRLRLN